MATWLKQGFGLVAILVGAGLLVAGVGQHWLDPGKPFRIGPLIRGLVLGGLFLSFGRKWLFNLIALDVCPVDPGNPEIADATRRAQATLPRLWDYLAENHYECFIKFPMRTEAGQLEHIWGVAHSRTEAGVVVSLANDPVDAPEDAAQRRVIPTKDIEDWQVMISESEIRGGYSVGALGRIAKSKGYRFSRADQKRLRAFVDAGPA